MAEQTGQRGEVESGTNSKDTTTQTSQDEADEMAGPDEQSGYEGDSGSSSGGSGSSGSGSSDGDSSDSGSSDSPSSDAGSSSDSESSDSDSSDSDSSDGGSSQEQDSGSSQESDSSNEQQDTQQQDTQQQDDQQQDDQQQASSDTDESSSPRGRESRTPANVGEALWKVANVLATVVRIVGYVLAAILVAFIVLTLVGVNTANGVAQVIGSVGNTAVFAFRDLFVLSDPMFTVIVNYALAAVFWVLVAEFGSRLVRWLGARLT